MEPHHARAGEIIVHQGHEPEGIFLIEEGEVEIRVNSRSGHSRRIATLSTGEYFGEIGLVTGMRRTANVIADTDARLLKLSKTSYIKYLASDTEVGRQLSDTAAARLAALLQSQ